MSKLTENQHEVERIIGIHAYTTDGLKVNLPNVDGTCRVGSVIEKQDKRWKVLSSVVNEDCVGGACPVK